MYEAGGERSQPGAGARSAEQPAQAERAGGLRSPRRRRTGERPSGGVPWALSRGRQSAGAWPRAEQSEGLSERPERRQPLLGRSPRRAEVGPEARARRAGREAGPPLSGAAEVR